MIVLAIRARRDAGFTLIELLVVIVIIAVLATLVAPNVFRHVGAANEATARTQIEMIGVALDAYRLDTGRYPTSEQGLQALWTRPTREPISSGPAVGAGAVSVLPDGSGAVRGAASHAG